MQKVQYNITKKEREEETHLHKRVPVIGFLRPNVSTLLVMPPSSARAVPNGLNNPMSGLELEDIQPRPAMKQTKGHTDASFPLHESGVLGPPFVLNFSR